MTEEEGCSGSFEKSVSDEQVALLFQESSKSSLDSISTQNFPHQWLEKSLKLRTSQGTATGDKGDTCIRDEMRY